MTVEELIEILFEAVELGHGDSQVVMSSDYEGNSFHDLTGYGFGVWDGSDLSSEESTGELNNALVLWP